MYHRARAEMEAVMDKERHERDRRGDHGPEMPPFEAFWGVVSDKALGASYDDFMAMWKMAGQEFGDGKAWGAF